MVRKFFTLSLLLAAFAMVVNAQSQTGEAVDGPEITFAENSKNFGDITQGDVIEHTFEFKNTGSQPLIISNVLVTCGCTATNWPRDPYRRRKVIGNQRSF